MRLTKTFSVLGALLCLYACGDLDERASEFISEIGNTEELLQDEELTADSVEDELETTLNILPENDVEDTSSLSLSHMLSGDSEKKINFHRACELDESGENSVAKVTITKSRKFMRSNSSQALVKTVNRKGKKTIVRSWSKDGSDVGCKENLKYADISDDNIVGMNMVSELEWNRVKSFTISNTSLNRKRARGKRGSFTGTKTTNFTALDLDSDADNKIVTKEVNFTGSKESFFKKLKGAETQLSRTIETIEPLIVKVAKSKADRKVVAYRIIESGKVKATNKNGGYAEVTYTNAKFESCPLWSGTVSGIKVNKDGETKKSYVINADSGLIEYADGTSKEYAPEGCDLDEDTAEKTEISNPESVEISEESIEVTE